MRPPIDDIAAPPFPRDLVWVNVAPLRMDKQLGRPVLVEFWDFCRPEFAAHASLPAARGTSATGPRACGSSRCTAPGFPPGEDEQSSAPRSRAWASNIPCAWTSASQLWRAYDNEGWPARYLWDGEGHLAEYHFGEGGYAETELAIQELLGGRARAARLPAPRGRPDGADRGPRPTSPAPTAAPTPPARCGPCSTAPGS